MRCLALLVLAACGGSSRPPASAPPSAPAAPTCAETAARMMLLQPDPVVAQLPAEEQDGWNQRLTDALVASCAGDAWPAAARTCIVDARDFDGVDACNAHLDATMKARLTDRTARLTNELLAELESRTSATGVAECDAYDAAFDDYLACGEVPEQARAAMLEVRAAMKASLEELRDPATPAEALQAAADACIQGRDAIRRAMEALGCPL